MTTLPRRFCTLVGNEEGAHVQVDQLENGIQEKHHLILFKPLIRNTQHTHTHMLLTLYTLIRYTREGGGTGDITANIHLFILSYLDISVVVAPALK